MQTKTAEITPAMQEIIDQVKAGRTLDITTSQVNGREMEYATMGVFNFMTFDPDAAKQLIACGLLEKIEGAGWSHPGQSLTCYRLKESEE